jgi:hypothetical protein
MSTKETDGEKKARDVILKRQAQVASQAKDDAPTGTKASIYALFNDATSSNAALWISNAINAIILASTFAFVAETTPMFRAPSYSAMWFTMECICVAAFTVDFIVRALTCPSFKAFRSDLMNWVDFIAIVPFYIELAFKLLDIPAGGLAKLRIIRVLRLARVLKVIAKAGAAEPSVGDDEEEDVGAVIGDIVANSGGALVIPLYFMLLALIVYASLEYYIERVESIPAVLLCTPGECKRACPTDNINGDDCFTKVEQCPEDWNCTLTTFYKTPGEFETNGFADFSSDMYPSIPEGKRAGLNFCYLQFPLLANRGRLCCALIEPTLSAFWWCIVTMTTVGYGDKFPLSSTGQLIAAMTAATGIFFISMPLAIVGSSFAASCDKLMTIQKQKDAVTASAADGYGALSYLSKSHAVMVTSNIEIEKNIQEVENLASGPPAPSGLYPPLAVSTVNLLSMALLYGRAGLKAQNGGFRPGQRTSVTFRRKRPVTCST